MVLGMDGSLIHADPRTDFGRWLKDRCVERGWETYRQAAAYTRVSHGQIRSYVVDGAHPRAPTTRRLARALKADERALLRVVALSEAAGPDAPRAEPRTHPRDFDIDTPGMPAVDEPGPLAATVLTYRPDGEVEALTARTARETASIARVVRAIKGWRAAALGEGDVGGGAEGSGGPL